MTKTEYPERLQSGMREALAQLIEWEAGMGRFEAPIWGEARNLMEEVRDFEDGRQTVCSLCDRPLGPDDKWTTEMCGPVCAACSDG